MFENAAYSIMETAECYVSYWSKFIISVMPPKLNSMVVCDFGAGTGIIGIKAVSAGAKYVTAIEKDPASRNLLRHNIEINKLSDTIGVLSSSREDTSIEHYDYIFCNPSCYPSAIGDASFFHAGEMGMDMIIEVFEFASRALKKNGHLLILMPSIAPRSIALAMLENMGLYARIVRDDLLVPFREHLVEKLIYWVESNKGKYPEMYYRERDGIFYENVLMYSIHFLDNTSLYKNLEDRFFEGFEYTIEMLPHDVISCMDAATAKMIPLKHELKSLVLKTEKGLYMLSLTGDLYADLRSVKRCLGVDEACLASENDLKSLGLKKGAVCPVLKRVWDMPQLISKEVFDLEYVSTNAGKLNECIMFNPKELLKHNNLTIGDFSKEKRNALGFTVG
jgi:prolyl-tRNA editing enzyme YbaK/EbsC (Cys-tRNA(Pro) deacylase)/precorrin-6B methylase 2